MMSSKVYVLLAVSCGLLSCEGQPIGGEQARGSSDKVGAEAGFVFASTYPLSYFTERILGSSEAVVFPEIDGDPAFWEPSAEDVTSMQQAGVILLNGATYEKWLEGVTLPERRVIDTSAPFADRYLTIAGAISHSHGPGAEHAHAGTAFTTWLDFSLAIQQATTINKALGDAGIGDPEQRNQNLAALQADLESLDDELKALTNGRAAVPLLASHPVYDYLAERYGLNIESVLWEPEVFPDEHQWELLNDVLGQHPAKWMIWEDEPLSKSIDRLSAMGIRSVVFNPSGNRPDDGDFLDVMRKNIGNLRPIFHARALPPHSQ